MTAFVTDSFTGTDGTLLPTYSANWVKRTEATADLEIRSNSAQVQDLGGAVYHNSLPPAVANYYAQAVLTRIAATSAGSFYGVCVRMQAAADTYYLFGHRSSTGWQVYKNVAGVFTQLGSTTASPTALTLNQGYTIKLDVVGTTINATVDAGAVCGSPITDSAIATAGFAGVYGGSSGETNSHKWDDLTAVDTTDILMSQACL